MGAPTVHGFIDTSTYLYAKLSKESEKSFWETTLSFMNPFEIEVWFIFWGLTVATGLAYFLFERGYNDYDVYGVRPFVSIIPTLLEK